MSDDFEMLHAKIAPFTIVGKKRLRSLFELAHRICTDDLPGCFVECGTFKGGVVAMLAYVVKRYSRRARQVYAFDTFEGLPAPGPVDLHQGIAAQAIGYGEGSMNASVERDLNQVCNALSVGDLVIPVPGLFKHTLPENAPSIGEISLLHAGADWYESTMTILDVLYDRVVAGGAVQVDDYGFWEGCRRAVHEFEKKRGLKFELNPIDDTGVWFRK